MNVSSCIPGRYLRLALLLLLLASQGIVNAHELGPNHSLDSHHCSICLIGHGLGSVVNAHPDVPQAQVAQAPACIHSITDVLAPRGQYYSTRAPPGSLCNSQKSN